MAKGDQPPQSILDRLFRRDRADEDTSENSDVGTGNDSNGSVDDSASDGGLEGTQDPTLARILDGDDVATIEPPQEPSLATDAGLIDEASPQLDSDLDDGRFDEASPQLDSDDTPDDLAFGRGSPVELAHDDLQIDASDQYSPADDAQIGASDEYSLGDDLRALDDARDPVVPPEGDQASHEIQIDDTTEHSDPTEVDID